jgi:hypothetical protein
MFILLLIIPLSVGILMMMIKRRTNPTRRTMTTREVTNHTRSPLVKLILINNESSNSDSDSEGSEKTTKGG